MPASKYPVTINVDLGEGYGNFKCGPDDELIPLIDHANVACGFHAGYVQGLVEEGSSS
jgi:lactam utilization protein B